MPCSIVSAPVMPADISNARLLFNPSRRTMLDGDDLGKCSELVRKGRCSEDDGDERCEWREAGERQESKHNRCSSPSTWSSGPGPWRVVARCGKSSLLGLYERHLLLPCCDLATEFVDAVDRLLDASHAFKLSCSRERLRFRSAMAEDL